jgi:hypothetical protein
MESNHRHADFRIVSKRSLEAAIEWPRNSRIATGRVNTCRRSNFAAAEQRSCGGNTDSVDWQLSCSQSILPWPNRPPKRCFAISTRLSQS